MSARPQSVIAIIVCCILLIAFAATAWLAAIDKSATVDEPTNLLGGWTQIHLHDYRYNCEDPALFSKFLGIGLPDDLFHIDPQSPQWKSLLINADARAPIATQALYHTPGLNADALLRTERLRMVAIATVIGIVIGWWAYRVAGPLAAIFAIVAFSFDPNFLAHAPLVKNDVLLAAAYLLFAASVWRLGERVTAIRFVAVCLCTGIAFTVKFSGCLAMPVLAILLLARSILPRPWPAGPFVASNFKHRLALSAAVFLVSTLFVWIFIWGCYGFRFLPLSGSQDQFDLSDNIRYFGNHQAFARSPDPFDLSPQAVTDFRQNWQPPAGVRFVVFANNHHLLPQSYLAGMLRMAADSQAQPTFLCGKYSVTGWWYYFPLAILFKTPGAPLVGSLAALVLVFPSLCRRPLSALWPLAVGVLSPAIYLLVAMDSNVDVGIRHILPIYPFLFVLLGIAAAKVLNSKKRVARFMLAVLTIGLVTETAFAFPNLIPFFNVFAGGSRGGFRLLGQSNIDWGQDLPALAAWQNLHPDRPLYLLYWGSADPRYYSIHYINLPQSTAPLDQTSPGPGRPVYAFSAVVLTNPFVRHALKPLFDTIAGAQPIAILNGSIYIYNAP